MDSSSSVTVTQREQMMVEQRVFQIYRLFADMPPTSQSFMLELQRDSHIEYLANGLRGLGSSFCVLDAMTQTGGMVVVRDGVYSFLRQMKQPNGGFRMHDGGEVDVRACYTAISVS
ncbi:hypothetical protein SAY86_009864 [Trapa natans]|uniref:Prenyltransferase alpha-alpha toroid domain-containing protein n=1 Tax=Trapa natans TaxID=22666 RepID=A0AAN7L0F2_TRANT|nr:hypothetical protein SAY86_009864 [Trapa natans]